MLAEVEGEAELTQMENVLQQLGRYVPEEFGGGRALAEDLPAIASAARTAAELRGEGEQLAIPLPQKLLKALDLPPGSTAPSWDVYEHLVDAADKLYGMGAKSTEDKTAIRARETRKASRFSKFEAQADKLAKEENDLAAENEEATAELEEISAQGKPDDPVLYRQLETKRMSLKAKIKRNVNRIEQLIKERERVQANKDKIYGAGKISDPLGIR